jgi:tetratricopeptide (TPR) repeat protein
MKSRAWFCGVAFVAIFGSLGSLVAHADDPVIESARRLLAAGNAGQAYTELVAVQDKMSGMPEYDYLLGVAALDSGRIEDAIIALERVLALVPNHAGAQMDLARAYYAAGSFDLAEAAFQKLKAQNPPPQAQIAINRYLEALEKRRKQTQAGWTAFGELGLGWDSNLTGVPSNFFAASQQAVGIGFDPSGNSVKRSAPFVQGAIGADYYHPLSRGWSLFGGGELRGRAYRDHGRKSTDESNVNFDQAAGELHGGGALNDGANQYRATASFSPFTQKGAAPGDPQPTNDRRVYGLNFDWRHALDTRTQAGLGLQLNSVRFPENRIEDFDQLFLSAAWLKSYERAGSPFLYVTGFVTEDRAKNKFDDGNGGQTSKSKNLAGLRGYFQYSTSPKVAAFAGLAAIYRRDRDSFARSNLVEKGKDLYGEASIGVNWSFREKCALRLQYVFSHNSSNIDIYDFNRSEISSTIRCEMI